MTDRAALLASLPTGPRRPLERTPARRLGSVRRTTCIEQRWDDVGRPHRVRGGGRDLVTLADGSTQAHGTATLRLVTDGAGNVAELASDPDQAQLQALVGIGVRAGFRSAATAALPGHAEQHSVLHQLLDDVPLATLIAGYGLAREHPEWDIPADAAARLRDLCAGWADGATMIGTLDRTGVFPIPVGPAAPPLPGADDPLGWHPIDPMERRSVRRIRRLDLWRRGSDLQAEAYFRDSHLAADAPEDVLHEYTVSATLAQDGGDGGALQFGELAATAHTLPWPECPGALSSVQRLSGAAVAEVAARVGDEFTGTSTCTHLNDVLRSMGALTAMAGLLR